MLDSSTKFDVDEITRAVAEIAASERDEKRGNAEKRAARAAKQREYASKHAWPPEKPELTAEAQTLHGQFTARRTQQAACDAEEARDLRAAIGLRLWRTYGCSTMVQYLEQHAGYSARAAYDRIRTAEELAQMPVLERVLASGAFCYSGVRELLRVVTPETVDVWLEHAGGMIVKEIEQEVSGRARGDLPTTPRKPELAMKRIALRALESEVNRFWNNIRKREELQGSKFVDETAMIRTVNDALEGSGVAGLAAPTQVWRTDDGRAWAHGVQISAAEAERLTCDSTDMGHVNDPKARSKRRRSKKRDLRILAAYGNKCAFPRCNVTINLRLHHLKPIAAGGRDRDKDKVPLCECHHGLTHDGLVEVCGSGPDKLIFRQPNVSGEWMTVR